MTVHLNIQSECGAHDLAVDCNIKDWGAPENTGYAVDIDTIFMERTDKKGNLRQRKLPKKLTDELSNSDDFINKILREAV